MYILRRLLDVYTVYVSTAMGRSELILCVRHVLSKGPRCPSLPTLFCKFDTGISEVIIEVGIDVNWVKPCPSVVASVTII